MSRFILLPMLVVLLVCISGGDANAQDANAQDAPPDAPILWLSAIQGGATHVYTWDGERAINLTPNTFSCYDFFPVPPDRWGWVCNMDNIERLFLWDGHSETPQIISGDRSVDRAQPAVSSDGQIAFVSLADDGADNGDLVVWDDGETLIVSGEYGAYRWETPLWTANGALLWRALQTNAGEYGIYHWDGERVQVIADRQQLPTYVEAQLTIKKITYC